MPAGREYTRDRGHGRREVIEIDEHVSRQHEVVFSPARRLVGQKRFELAGDEAVVKAFHGRLRDHRRREVDTGQPIRVRAKGGAAKSRAAAEIEHGAETHCPPGGVVITASTARRSSSGPR